MVFAPNVSNVYKLVVLKMRLFFLKKYKYNGVHKKEKIILVFLALRFLKKNVLFVFVHFSDFGSTKP